MKKINLITALLTLCYGCVFSQPSRFEHILNVDYDIIATSGLVHPFDSEYTANKEINLTAGFNFNSSGHTFLAMATPKKLAILDETTLTGGPSGEASIVGNDGVVGAIPGNLAVSPSGAATYTIPIECPPGINGMTPSIALTYNSQAGNGIAGYGWNLSGLSAITRVPKTVYHDGEYKPIQWNDQDVFAYNGVRMFETAVSGNEREYRLENDPTVKIKAYNWGSYGPDYFEVWMADGKKFTYGKGNDYKYQPQSKIGDNSWKYVLSYNITSIIDIFGNEIEFSYEFQTITEGDYITKADYRINQILYPKSTSGSSFYDHRFSCIKTTPNSRC